MDMTTVPQNNMPQADPELTQQDLNDMSALDQRIDVAIEISRLQDLAQKIEAEGTPEMKAKLKPFKEHYDGDVMTLVTKRTKQNFDNDVWQEVAKAGDEAKAKYRQNPDGYLAEDQRAEYWEKAFDKTVEEARMLAHNLEQVVQSSAAKAESAPSSSAVPTASADTAPKRRLFNR